MRTEIANLSNDGRRDRMGYCGEHDAADPEGATADGPVVAAVLAEVGRERVALLGTGEDVSQVHVDGEEAVQDPGLDAQ